MKLQEFKNWLLLNGRAYNTAQNYTARIGQLLFSIKEITTENLSIFLRDLQTKQKASTVNAYLNAIRAYFKFLKITDIEIPKKTKEVKTLPESFDEDYLEKILIPRLEQIIDKDYLKIKAICYFLFYTGIRIGEIDRLYRKNFDLENNKAKIIVSKTKEERIIFFTNKTKDIIKMYFDTEEETINAFNTKSNTIKVRFYRLKEYFPEINFHPHIFKHSFAVHCLRKGVDLLTVSKLLGHTNTRTTERYLKLTDAQFQTIYREKLEDKRSNL